MKIRSGFVSNSSSSSFVLIGAYATWNPTKEEQIKIMDKANLKYNKEFPEDYFHDYINNGHFGFTYFDEPGVIGLLIAELQEYDNLKETEIDLNKLNKEVKRTHRAIKNITGLDIKMKLITGSRYI